MQFLNPTSEFVAWLIRRASGRQIIDVGCGEGQLTKAIYDAGYHKVIGIDIRNALSEEFTDYRFIAKHFILGTYGDVVNSPLCAGTNTLAVLARPCHGSFPQLAHEYCDGELLYVGLMRNVSDDLAEYIDEFEIVSTPIVSADDDNDCYVVLSRKPRMHLTTFHLVKTDAGSVRPEISWRRYANSLGPRSNDIPLDTPNGYWVNSGGSGFHRTASDHVLQTVESINYMQLDHSLTSYYERLRSFADKEDVYTGWLAPDGKLHRCAYQDHDDYAYYVLKHYTDELIDDGWRRLHCQYDGGSPVYVFVAGGDPNDAQAEALVKLQESIDKIN